MWAKLRDKISVETALLGLVLGFAMGAFVFRRIQSGNQWGSVADWVGVAVTAATAVAFIWLGLKQWKVSERLAEIEAARDRTWLVLSCDVQDYHFVLRLANLSAFGVWVEEIVAEVRIQGQDEWAPAAVRTYRKVVPASESQEFDIHYALYKHVGAETSGLVTCDVRAWASVLIKREKKSTPVLRASVDFDSGTLTNFRVDGQAAPPGSLRPAPD